MSTETVWEFACRVCDRRSLHRDQAEASLAAKAHACPSGKRTAGMVSMTTAVVGIDVDGRRSYSWPTPEENRNEAHRRQRRIEETLRDA